MHHQKNHYTFTWRRNSDHLRDALKEMMTSSEFTDVTLVTDDKQLIRAHRNILGACSPVFKNILQLEINSANPVIYLRGIQHSEIESILQFIYLGEARIYKERMSEFLIVSKNLEIMELSTGINYQTDSNEKIDEYENYIADAENIDEKPAPTFNGDDANVECETQISNMPVFNGHEKNPESRKYSCKECGKQYNFKQNLNIHIQSTHEGVKYACNQCGDQLFSLQSSLRLHIKSKHEGIKYDCNQCDYQAGYQGDLKIHIKNKHEGVKHTCSQCGQEFSQQSHLATHIKSKHKGVKYDCNQCDFQTTLQSSLRRHINRKH